MNKTSIHKIKGWNKHKDPKTTSITSLYCKYRNDANRHSRDFNLSRKEFENLIFDSCHYCGVKPSNWHNRYLNKDGKKNWTARKSNMGWNRINKATVYFNGIDRKDNNIGYDLYNCVTCCQICNEAKHTRNYEDFIKWINNLVRFRK